MMMAKIFFLMGVSGSGKTTILHKSGLLKRKDIKYIPSYTTRDLRPGEIDGEKYFHISKKQFEQDIRKGVFLEYAFVHQSDYYGTQYHSLVEPLEKGISVIKELEVYGLEKIQNEGKIDGLYTTIFLDLSKEKMKERILGRGRISEDYLQKRLESASGERVLARELCDYIVDASQTLENVIEAFLEIINITI